ncbi:hypothetical protein MKW98_026058 [Papaver atlanticum]|uniref:Epidermal patterning factor-like protein n=1 Tax=Papaver atlanticum TaxID=357466 RepID=A0AAD4X5L5_9MAGN|nr:hypothetical protein MKW98_026058 [Papaver atlanticum]
MKNGISFGSYTALLAAIFFSVFVVDMTASLSTNGEGGRGDPSYIFPKKLGVNKREEVAVEMYPTGGSSLPDCSHACGPCFPCKRVMVSFRCASTESCPVVYRCMCKGRYYHVPSN